MALLKFDNERISNSEKQNGKALKNFFKMTISIFGKVSVGLLKSCILVRKL